MDEMEKSEVLKRKALNWLWISMGSLAATLLLVQISFVFFWIFGGLATYAFFLFIWFLDKATRPKASVQSKKIKTISIPPSKSEWRKFTVVEWLIFGFISSILLSLVFYSFRSKVIRQNPIVAENFNEADYDEPDDESVAALTAKGVELIFQQDFDQALVLLNRALQKDPQYLDAIYNKGLVFNYQGDERASIRQARRCIQIDAGYTIAYTLLANNYYTMEMTDSALFWYEKSYAAQVIDKQNLVVLGYLNEISGNTTRATRIYKEMLAYDSTSVYSYNRLAELDPSKSAWYARREKYWTERNQ